MAKLQQIMQANFEKRLNKNISFAKLRIAANEAGKLMVELMQKRVMENTDVYGKQFRKYKPSYIKYKKRLLSGKSKSKYAKRIKQAQSRYGKFAPNRVGSKIRLSGELLSSIMAKPEKIYTTKNKFNISVKMYVPKIKSSYAKHTLQQRGEWLRKNGFNWFGLALKGAYQKREEKLIRERIMKEIGLDVVKGGSIKLR